MSESHKIGSNKYCIIQFISVDGDIASTNYNLFKRNTTQFENNYILALLSLLGLL